MPGTFTYTPEDVPLARSAAVALVYRYSLTSQNPGYEFLPNVRPLEIHKAEGDHPGSARFRYAFDDLLNNDPGDPTRAEQVFGLDIASTHVVNVDDRLVVRLYYDSGQDDYFLIFDGFVNLPQLDLGPDTEQVTFEAYATPVRLWDNPLLTARYRGSDRPTNAGGFLDVQVPVRFNPGGKPNASPVGYDEGQGGPNPYPVFVDHRGKIPTGKRRLWTLGMAARYLLMTANADEDYVDNPDFTGLDALLESKSPVGADDTGPIDVNNPATYESNPVEVLDLEVWGDKLPVALAKVVEPHGFAFRFNLDEGDDGAPRWAFDFYRKDATVPVKGLKLQAAGAAYDPNRTNLDGVSLQRDGQVVNAYAALSSPTLVEGCVVLAPLFPVAAADATTASRPKWDQTSPAFDPVGYRRFGFDETGLGHWDFTTNALETTVALLDDLLGDPDPAGEPAYVNRPRPGRSTLLTKGADGERLKATLWVSTDYSGKAPAVWDGTGTWQQVTQNWKVLEDALGVELTGENMVDWNIGKPAAGAPRITGGAGGVLNVPQRLAAPTATQPVFYLALTTVVEADTGIQAAAPRRNASPTRFEVWGADEVRDRFQNEVVNASSENAQEDAYGLPRTFTLQDDTPDQKAHLDARRRSTEFPALAGSVSIPRITTAYEVGDRISGVEGRGISFAQNRVTDPSEAPVLPVVVGVTWTFGDRQTTTLHLSDRRAEPPPERRR